MHAQNMALTCSCFSTLAHNRLIFWSRHCMNISQLRLLTKGNPKLLKSLGKGYLSFILHFAPAKVSGHEVCPFRTKECTALCLNLAGRGGIFKRGETTNGIQQARIRRTKLFFENRQEFLSRLVEEIETACLYAMRKGLIPCIRLNGTSDIPWENHPVERGGIAYQNVFEAFPDVQFYDYTKWPIDKRNTAIPNYYLTFSLAETLDSRLKAAQWLENGFNVSAVFETANFPETFLGHPTVNGDESDLRFLDKPNSIVALKIKGRKRLKTGGFINATIDARLSKN